MAVTDVWADWSSTAGSNTPLGSATPEIDDEVRNIKAQTKGNCVDKSAAQTIAGIKTFTSLPVIQPASSYSGLNMKGVGDATAYVYLRLQRTADNKEWLITYREDDGGGFRIAYYDGASYYNPIIIGTDRVVTFSQIPALPAADPTTDNQAVRKAYVDAKKKTIRIPHTWAIPGEIKVPSGDVDYIVPFFVAAPAGQTVKAVAARHRINSGTSVTAKIQQNGVDLTGFTGISVTTTSTTTDPADQTLADGDLLALVVTAVSGTPKNMTFTLWLEYEV